MYSAGQLAAKILSKIALYPSEEQHMSNVRKERNLRYKEQKIKHHQTAAMSVPVEKISEDAQSILRRETLIQRRLSRIRDAYDIAAGQLAEQYAREQLGEPPSLDIPLRSKIIRGGIAGTIAGTGGITAAVLKKRLSIAHRIPWITGGALLGGLPSKLVGNYIAKKQQQRLQAAQDMYYKRFRSLKKKFLQSKLGQEFPMPVLGPVKVRKPLEQKLRGTTLDESLPLGSGNLTATKFADEKSEDLNMDARQIASYVLTKVAAEEPRSFAWNAFRNLFAPKKERLPTREQLMPRTSSAAAMPQVSGVKTAPVATKAAPVVKKRKGLLNLNAPENKLLKAKYSPKLITKWNEQYAAKQQAKGKGSSSPIAQAAPAFSKAPPQNMAWLDPYLRSGATPVSKSPVDAWLGKSGPAQKIVARPRQVRDVETAQRATPKGKGRKVKDKG